MKAHVLALIRELQGIECKCRRPKEPRQTFCKSCYYSLPPRLRKALYQVVGSGYEQAYHEAVAFLTTRGVYGVEAQTAAITNRINCAPEDAPLSKKRISGARDNYGMKGPSV